MNRTSLFALLLSLSACAGSGRVGPSAPAGHVVESITVTSKTFAPGGSVPIDNSCDGAEKSPQLTWSAPPPGTRSIAIVVEDVDAAGSAFTQWIAFDLAPDTLVLSESADVSAVGGKVGANDAKSIAYRGPCPPKGEGHRYMFHVYAVSVKLGLHEGVSRSDFDAALNGHVLGEGAVMGTYAH